MLELMPEVAGVTSEPLADGSIFPSMLLARMNQEEILDLVAYVLSGGNREHAYFQK